MHLTAHKMLGKLLMKIKIHLLLLDNQKQTKVCWSCTGKSIEGWLLMTPRGIGNRRKQVEGGNSANSRSRGRTVPVPPQTSQDCVPCHINISPHFETQLSGRRVLAQHFLLVSCIHDFFKGRMHANKLQPAYSCFLGITAVTADNFVQQPLVPL